MIPQAILTERGHGLQTFADCTSVQRTGQSYCVSCCFLAVSAADSADWWVKSVESPEKRYLAHYALIAAEHISYDSPAKKLIEEGIDLMTGELRKADYLRETLPFLASIFHGQTERNLAEILDELVAALEKKKGAA